MRLALLLQNLGAAWLQGLLLAGAAMMLARLFPLERPRLKLLWWQLVLLLAVGLPFVQAGSPGLPAARTDAALLAIRPALAAPRAAFGLWSWAEVVAAVLAVGVAIGTIRFLIGFFRLRSVCRRARPLDGRGALARWRQEIGVRATFLSSGETGGPATFGVLRPVVLLPAAFLAMDAERQRAVAVHELLHVRRRDWLFTLLEEALRVAFWFQPAVHWLLGRVHLSREQCVDEAVVGVLGGRQVYLESLLEMARVSLRRQPLPAALLLREHHLRDRVELLLKEVTMTKLRNLSHLAASVAVLMLAGALAAWSFPLEDTKAEKASAKAQAGKTEKKEVKGEGPRVLHRVDAVYPETAKKAGIEGDVVLEIKIAKTGDVADARVVSGPEALTEAALTAVRQWRFEPPTGPDKKPAEVVATISVRFALD